MVLRHWQRFSRWVVAQEIDRPLWLNAKLRVQFACLCVFLPPGAAVGALVGIATGRSLAIAAFVGAWGALLFGNLYFYVAIIRARQRRPPAQDAESPVFDVR